MDRDDIDADSREVGPPTENVSRSLGFILEIEVQGSAQTVAGSRLESQPLQSTEDCIALFSCLLDRESTWSRWGPDAVIPEPWEKIRTRRKVLSTCADNLVFDFVISDLESKNIDNFQKLIFDLILLLKNVRKSGFHGHWICGIIYEEFETIAVPIKGAYYVTYPFYIMPSETVNGLKWVATLQDSTTWWEYHDTQDDAKAAISDKRLLGKTKKEVAREAVARSTRYLGAITFAVISVVIVCLILALSR